MIDIPTAAIATELTRELAARESVYRGHVAKGRMTEAQAAHGKGVIAAMREDLARMDAPYVRGAAKSQAEHAFTWIERRNALLRELDYRARFYPGWIAEGQFDQAEADRRNAALEALLHRYEEGFDWRPSSGLPPPWRIGGDAAEQQARAEWHAVYFEACLRRADQPMAEALLREIALHDPTRAAELEPQLHPARQEEMAL